MRRRPSCRPAIRFLSGSACLPRVRRCCRKSGQILARDQRLPLELRQHLRELESLAPTVPLEIVRQTLTQELGDLEALGITLQPAIAEASVAIVVPFLKGKGAGNQLAPPGVFKVLKPGIEQQLEHELEPAAACWRAPR